jgi:hypothetical protein
MAGEPLWLARAFPVTVDGLVLAALRRGPQGRWWLRLGVGGVGHRQRAVRLPGPRRGGRAGRLRVAASGAIRNTSAPARRPRARGSVVTGAWVRWSADMLTWPGVDDITPNLGMTPCGTACLRSAWGPTAGRSVRTCGRRCGSRGGRSRSTGGGEFGWVRFCLRRKAGPHPGRGHLGGRGSWPKRSVANVPHGGEWSLGGGRSFGESIVPGNRASRLRIHWLISVGPRTRRSSGWLTTSIP